MHKTPLASNQLFSSMRYPSVRLRAVAPRIVFRPVLPTFRRAALATGPTFRSKWIGVEEPGGPRIHPGDDVPSTPAVARLSPIFTGVLVVGVAAVMYGIYSIYGTMTMWPVPVRKDLRNALAAKSKGDLDLSAQYLQRAWDTARSLPTGEFKSEPYLKISGIAIALAGVLESAQKLELAYGVYKDALAQLQDASGNLKAGMSGQENLRAVAISYKLGEMAQMLKKPRDEEESLLVWCVENVLKNVMEKPVQVDKALTLNDAAVQEESTLMVSELELPLWATKQDLASPFEALGSFYSRTGKVDFALPLYLQALSVLIPPTPHMSSSEDKCRGAQLMGGIAELILRSSPSKESIAQAKSWARKGLEVADKERKGFRKHEVCEMAYAVMLYNLAIIEDMAGEGEKAHDLLTQSMNQSNRIGHKDGVTQAQQALEAIKTNSSAKFSQVMPGEIV